MEVETKGDFQKIHLSMKKEAEKSYLIDDYRHFFKGLGRLTWWQKLIFLLDAPLRLYLIFEYISYGELRPNSKAEFIICIIQTGISFLTMDLLDFSWFNKNNKNNFFLNTTQKLSINVQKFLVRLFNILLKILQIDCAWLIFSESSKNTALGLSPVTFQEIKYRKKRQLIVVWFYLKRIFVFLRLQYFFEEIINDSNDHSPFEYIGFVISGVSILTISFVFVQMNFLSSECSLTDSILILCELSCALIQSLLYTVYLRQNFYATFLVVSGYFLLLLISLFQTINLVIVEFKTVGMLESLFFGQHMCYLTPLIKRDMKQYSVVTFLTLSFTFFILNACVQYFVILINLPRDSMAFNVKMVQIFTLVISILLMVGKIVLILELMKKSNYQVHRLADIQENLAVCRQIVTVRIHYNVEGDFADTDQAIMKNTLDKKLFEFFYYFFGQYYVYSKRGHAILKVEMIRNREEILQVIQLLLECSESLKVEFDPTYTRVARYLNFQMLRIQTGQNYNKLLNKQEELLDYFLSHGRDYRQAKIENDTLTHVCKIAAMKKLIFPWMVFNPSLIYYDLLEELKSP